MITIKKYKGIPLKYNESNGKIHFIFEETERVTNYIFEAKEIIDEPVWEPCDLEGYYVTGYSEKYIGLAKAKRKDIKSGKPDWRYKGEYDIEYRRPEYTDSSKRIYPKNEHNNNVYERWLKQRKIYENELGKSNSITTELSGK